MNDATLVKATINGQSVAVPAGTTILEAAEKVCVRIPRLCLHPDLPPMAACGICVVRLTGTGRMVRACHTPLEPGMDITTHDPEIVQVRRSVIELILSKHPNECLTCGRNGLCELQTLAAEFGIRSESLPSIVPDLPLDASTKAIVLDPRKCVTCGRCVEVCQQLQQVWALSFLDRGIETRISGAGGIPLADSPCVYCGQCSAHCPTGAILEYDETARVWDHLMDPNKYCVVQIAPAVRVAVGEAFGFDPGTQLTGKLYAALRHMGFKAVFDTNFGADVTIMEEAHEFVSRFALGPAKAALPLITSCCPSWVDFMEKYWADMIPHFSTCKSPHAILGALAKTYYAQLKEVAPEKMVVVSVMPCTAKKREITRSNEMYASQQQDVDVSLTTREIARMIKQAGIDFRRLEPEPSDHLLGEYSGAGTLFGVTGGVMEAALRTAHYLLTQQPMADVEYAPVRGLKGIKTAQLNLNGQEVRLAVAHGLRHVDQVLSAIWKAKQNGEEPPYHFVEVMACPGGCVGGGGQPYGATNELRLQRSRGLYQDDRNCQRRCSHENPFVQQLYKNFLGEPNGSLAHHLLHTHYVARPVYRY